MSEDEILESLPLMDVDMTDDWFYDCDESVLGDKQGQD